jgi:PAS domain S-box-containing protein
MPDRLDDAFFRSLFESDIAGLAVADLTTQTVVEANDRLLEIIGRTRDQVVDVPSAWMDLTPPEYHPLDLAAIEAVLAGRRADPFEKEYLLPDGGRIPVRVGTSLVRGRPGKVLIFVTDLTDQREREAEVRNNEMQLRLLADAVPALISFIDRDLRYRLVNRAYESWFGLPRSEIIGKTVGELLGQEAADAREEIFEAVFAGKPQEFEAFTPVPGGSARATHIQYVPRFTLNREVDGFYVLVNDISGRKAIEEELRRSVERLTESEARFRAMAEAAPVMIWLSGPGGESEYLNRAYLEFFGSNEADVLGFGWMPIAHPDDAEGNLQEYLAALREQRPFEVEARFRRADGRYRLLHSVGVPRFDAHGSYLGHIGVSRDVTDERGAEAQQKLLIGELNHRVKNTLAIVQSLAWQTLRDQSVSPEVGRSFEQRLMALATAHDVLTTKNWNPASIELIIRGGLDALSIGQERVSIVGPLLRVPPKTAVSLAMAVHELATNALKYGSLSIPQGEVLIAWEVNDERFELTWTERGGPPVSAPSRRGFGTRLLQRGLAAELEGDAVLNFDPAGLVCTIAAPLPAGAYFVA